MTTTNSLLKAFTPLSNRLYTQKFSFPNFSSDNSSSRSKSGG